MRQITTGIRLDRIMDTISDDHVTILAPESEGEAHIMRTAMVAAAEAMGASGVAGPQGPAQGWSVRLGRPAEAGGDGWAGVSLYIETSTRTQPDLCGRMFAGGEDAVAPYTISILCHMAYMDDGRLLLCLPDELPDELRIDSDLWVGCLPAVALA